MPPDPPILDYAPTPAARRSPLRWLIPIIAGLAMAVVMRISGPAILVSTPIAAFAVGIVSALSLRRRYRATFLALVSAATVFSAMLPSGLRSLALEEPGGFMTAVFMFFIISSPPAILGAALMPLLPEEIERRRKAFWGSGEA